jgi:hypothetical protein
MKVEDIFRRLSVGHLSNLSLAESGSGNIKADSKNKIIEYINETLQELYSRFALQEREATIMQYMHITQYHLDKRYAENNVQRPVGNIPYIMDLPKEPFSDDAVKILSVVDNCGNYRPLNDDTKANSFFTPYPTTLQVPNPQEGEILTVIYQALHVRLEFGVYNAEVFIPLALEKAFLSYVAGCVFRDIGSENTLIRSQGHFNDYESVCANVEKMGHAAITSVRNRTKFHDRGFV